MKSKTIKIAERLDTTVVKAASLFEALATADTPQSISSLSKMLGLQKSNIHRLLHTWINLGFVLQDGETKRYYPTLKVWEIGLTVARRDFLRVAARPFLMQLTERTSFPAFLGVFSGTDVIYIDTIGTQLADISPIGSRALAVYPSSGKAILAFQKEPAAILDRIIATNPQAAGVNKRTLLKEFAEIRRLGFATSVSGIRQGRNAVSAPIKRSTAPPIAAVGIGGPAERMTKKLMLQHATAVLDAAAGIGEIAPAYESGL